MPQVWFIANRCKDQKELDKLEPWLGFLQDFARFWDIDIEVDVPHGEIQPPLSGSRLYLHFFSVPSPVVPGWEKEFKYLNHVFGWPLQEKSNHRYNWSEVYTDETSVALVWEKGDGRIHSIISPEEDVVALVTPNNIYILFDIVHQNEYVRQASLELILKQILEEAIPEALKDRKSLFSYPRQERDLRRVTQNIRQGFLERQDQARDQFVRFCIQPLFSRLAETRKALNNSRQEHEGCYQELSRLNLEARFLARQLESLKKKKGASPRNYAWEFDMLLKMRQIKGVRVEPDRMMVYTKRILLRGEYNVGEFIINIVFRSRGVQEIDGLKRDRIFFTMVKDSGEYLHPHAFDSSGSDFYSHRVPCFGNDLNHEIDKLCVEGELFRIIQWCILFLEEDSETSIARWTEIQAVSHADETVALPAKEEPFYASRQNLEEERQKYASAAQTLKEVVLTQNLEIELRKFEGKAASKWENFIEARTKLRKHQEARELLEQEINANSARFKKEFDDLARMVLAIDVNPNVCQVVFSGPNRTLARLWLRPKQVGIWVRGWNLDLPQVNEYGEVLLPEKMGREIGDLLIQREMAQAALALRVFLFGEKGGDNE